MKYSKDNDDTNFFSGKDVDELIQTGEKELLG